MAAQPGKGNRGTSWNDAFEKEKLVLHVRSRDLHHVIATFDRGRTRSSAGRRSPFVDDVSLMTGTGIQTSKMATNLCVLGAGVIGLSTAVQLQQRFPDIPVTVIADSINEETLSSGAGGIFRLSERISGPHTTSVKKWGTESYKHYSMIMRSEDACLAGIQEVSGYMLLSDLKNLEKELKFLKYFHSNARVVSEAELQTFPGHWRGGIFFTTVVIDGSRYLPFLLDKFTKYNGIFIRKTISSFTELADEYDIVINCGGLRAAELASDVKVVPIRGQLLRVKAPWIKHFYYGDFDTYIIPSTDTVALGGTRQFMSYNVNVDQRDSDGILERCTNIIPSLKHATLLKEWVGLRPYRDPIRVECEVMDLHGKQLKIVHNYGHGQYGITLSWGSAMEAVDIIEKMLTLTRPVAKL